MKKYRIVILEHQESSLLIIETKNNRSNEKKYFDYQLMTKDEEYTITYFIGYKGKEHLEIYQCQDIFFCLQASNIVSILHYI